MLEQQVFEEKNKIHKKKTFLNINNIITTLLFLLLLLAIPFTFLLSKPVKLSNIENRTLNQFKVLTLSSFIDKTFQDQLNKAVTDQFPLRDNLLIYRSFIFRNVNRIAYSPFKDDAIPGYDSNNVLIWNNGKNTSLIYTPKRYQARTLKNIDKRIEEYDKIKEAFPDINIYVFDVEMPANSKFHPLNDIYSSVAGSQYSEYFKIHNKSVVFSQMRITSKEDIIENFYKTDHHWNICGAWKGYQLIYDLLKTNYSEISEKKQAKSFEKVEGIQAFRGALARLAVYPTIKDDFLDVKLKYIETYKTLINGEEAKRGLREVNKSERKFNESLFANHYGNYFGSDKGLVEYIFENKSDRNLLIVGQSFTQAIEYIIASHYAHTYVVDLRHYDKDIKYPFDAINFIKENNIKDILILGDDEVCFSQLESGLLPETRALE